jgi:CheY-like chemotaxis protein
MARGVEGMNDVNLEIAVKVLVIEDNEDAADSLRDVLQLRGHVVEVAYTGEAGLAKARAFHPDVVLCDIGLPGLNGYEVAQAFRGEPALASTKLVAVTAYAQPEDRRRAREAGFNAHFGKPPDLNALERAIASAPN